MVYDVPKGMENDAFLKELYWKNVRSMCSEEEFMKASRIVSKMKTRDGQRVHVMVEMATDVYDVLLHKGKVYIEWNLLWIREVDMVTRCFNCNGYGHFLRECNVGKLCVRCGEKGHVGKECKNEVSCVNCKSKGAEHGHSVLSAACPEYCRMKNLIKERYG